MKKVILLLTVLALVLGLSGCVKADLPDSAKGSSVTADSQAEAVALGDLEYADSLKINFAMGNNARTMTYQKSTPLKLPDGTVVSQGDLKPTWQFIEKALGFKIEDVTVQDQKPKEMVEIAAATGFDQATVFGGGGSNIASFLMNYGAQGYFINLKDYMDYMPDLKAYLEKNPSVAKAITAHDGGIYHLPYIAEIGNYARVYNARTDWITSLLDSEDVLESESNTLNVAYEGYWNRHSSNVIDLQNAAAKGGVLAQADALSVLKDYIAQTYPDLARPSDLYVGLGAQYDIDELVALWRVVELSPNTLSKVSTGKVVPGAEISPYFVRKSKYREDVLRMLNYFDGQKVHGSDTYTSRLVVNEKGEMIYTYADDEFLSKVEYVKQWFDEGLLHSEFADREVNTDEFRKSMYFADDTEGQKQFGFMTFDWIASTTAGSDKINSILPPVTTVSKAGVNEFIHYIENTRAIKSDGWSISAAADEKSRNAALALFNYMFTPEGSDVQVYSIPDGRKAGDTYKGSDGNMYPEFDQWMFDAAGEYKNGDVSGFLRDFMGSLLSVGYQKEIGFEMQYTSENGLKAWKLYNDAKVLTNSYGAENDYFRMMPPLISLKEQEVAKVETTAIGGEGLVEKMFLYIKGADGAVGSAAELGELYKESGIDTYLDVYKGAYDRMMAGN
ncbi:MAG: hypothetical protein PQJ58_04710 [Spirochaetales bacterium]|nr:hypothetical protein [Spirochaetales bacterium]